MSIESKIGRLVTAQNGLIEKISAKGVTVPQGTKIPDCPELIEGIESHAYVSEGTITVVQTSDTLTIANLPQKPKEVGIISQSLREASLITSQHSGFAIPDILAFFEDDTEDEITVDGCVITRSQANNETWQVEFSFEDYNTDNPDEACFFMGGYVYNWVALYSALI